MIADKKRKILEKSISDNTLLIIYGKSEILRNGDVLYPFRQDSDFLLLTGLNIPDLRLLAYKENGSIEWILYSDPITEKEQLWGTNRLGYDALEEQSGISTIRRLAEWKGDIRYYSEKAETITIRACDTHFRDRALSKSKDKFLSLEPELRKLRMFKIHEEIDAIRHAISVTQEALELVEKNIDSYHFEREIEADIAQVYRRNGCIEAYPSIVASGPNASTLHYTRYDRELCEGDLILIDTGAEFKGYAADISRTFKKGMVSERRKQVYDAVKSIQNEALAATRPGRSWDEHEKVMRGIINISLKKLGLIPENCTTGEEEILSRRYFPHRMSHFLGLDVHDSGARNDILLPGMVITCEPAIYISEEEIGIRIEDDILITLDGCVVLSSNIIK